MNTMKYYVKGTCMEMCPLEEIQMREKEKLLHVLEMTPGTENSGHPKANRNYVVKCFSRSAAGKALNKPENLRPPDVLLKTVNYLLFDVIYCDHLPWYKIYDFITDRLMAIRQDMVVQNISVAEIITILQPIIRFHAYAAYRLCNESLSNFDPVLNNNHLQECLKNILNSYDTYNAFATDRDLPSNERSTLCQNYLVQHRAEFEALYIVFHIGNEEVLRRALTIPQIYKSKTVRDAIKLSVCYIFGNFVRICRLMKNLPPLVSAVASLFLPEIRRKALRIMSTSHHSKNLTFPLTDLKEILLYESASELVKQCKYYGIRTDNQNIYFSKQSFITTKPAVTPKHETFVDNKLKKESVHNILFGTMSGNT